MSTRLSVVIGVVFFGVVATANDPDDVTLSREHELALSVLRTEEAHMQTKARAIELERTLLEIEAERWRERLQTLRAEIDAAAGCRVDMVRLTCLPESETPTSDEKGSQQGDAP